MSSTDAEAIFLVSSASAAERLSWNSEASMPEKLGNFV
jgi:hypothetical protein